MKELYQINKRITKIKQWKKAEEIVSITLCDNESINLGHNLEFYNREDRDIVISMPISIGLNFQIGQIVNLSISTFKE